MGRCRPRPSSTTDKRPVLHSRIPRILPRCRRLRTSQHERGVGSSVSDESLPLSLAFHLITPTGLCHVAAAVRAVDSSLRLAESKSALNWRKPNLGGTHGNLPRGLAP